MGSATTDDNGVASYTYTGHGSGEMDFIASTSNPFDESSLVSGTFVVYDTLYHDEMQSDTTNNYTKTGCTLTFDTDKFVLTRIEGAEAVVNLNLQGDNVNQYLGKDVVFEFEIVDTDAGIVPRIMQNRNGSWESIYGTTKSSGVASLQGTIKSDTTRIFFRVSGNNLAVGQSCSFKNFRIYLI